jgi:hypothetical protein
MFQFHFYITVFNMPCHNLSGYALVSVLTCHTITEVALAFHYRALGSFSDDFI